MRAAHEHIKLTFTGMTRFDISGTILEEILIPEIARSYIDISDVFQVVGIALHFGVFPFATVLAAEQGVGFVITGNDFFLTIPVDTASQLIREHPE